MPKKIGFHILQLVCIGNNKKAASVSFKGGLNIISGLSNTGKSYILECIDYMLGAENVPKPIDQAIGYERMFLEIKDANDECHVLERSMKGGAFKLYDGRYQDIDEDSGFIPLQPKYTKDDKDNISNFLLSMFDSSDKKIMKSKDGKTQSLTFRTLYHLFIISENKIISDKSIISLDSGYARTASKMAFNYMLTGIDDSAVIQITDTTEEDSQGLIKKDIYDKLIAGLEKVISEKDISRGNKKCNFEKEKVHIKHRIAEVSEIVSINSEEVTVRLRERKEIWDKIQQDESRILVISEIVKRFELLQQHYASDLERLDFISEASDYFEQLEFVNCPLCGNDLSKHDYNRLCQDDSTTFITIQESCAKEASKIRSHEQDLNSTISELSVEMQDLNRGVSVMAENLKKIDAELNDNLNPKAMASKDELNELMAQMMDLTELETNYFRLEELRSDRNSLSVSSREAPEDKVHTDLSVNALRKLCDKVEHILRSWKFEGSGVVEFDQRYKVLDLNINGVPRKSNGKGVRALTHAAFSIALLKYCKENSLPHAGFVLLDSPLLNLKEKDDSGLNEEVSGDVQTAFFHKLSEIPDEEQVIVFENKVPPKKLISRINFLEYEDGTGFYPT